MRGEYLAYSVLDLFYLELPPRARRILAAGLVDPNDPGTTSACAENTAWPYRTSLPIWNYLRVRGEYGIGTFGGGKP